MIAFSRKTAGPDYYEVLERIHSLLKPRTYVEIGVRQGHSFRLARTASPLSETTRLRTWRLRSGPARAFSE